MNIGVFFGGKNTEHDVSILTGQLIISGLKDLGHNVIPVYISKKGQWFADEVLGNLDFFKSGNLDEKLKSCRKFVVNMGNISSGSLEMSERRSVSILHQENKVKMDLAFPAIHGKNGEDGTIQGMFELLDIPYVGCDVLSSAVAIDKVMTKVVYERFNFPTTKFVHFTTQEWLDNKDKYIQEIKKINWPVFVKPARLGSSIGMKKVSEEKELEFAIEVALHYDSKVLVEEAVENLMDITVCVIGNEDPVASLIQESAYSKDFFSYEDKYLNDGGAQIGNAEKSIIIPARLDEKTTEEIRSMAKDVYKTMGCTGIARVDFLYNTKTKKYFVNELNTLPGTIYHHLWAKSGVTLKELLEKLLKYAKERYDKNNKVTFTFDSPILKSANSNKLKLKGN